MTVDLSVDPSRFSGAVRQSLLSDAKPAQLDALRFHASAPNRTVTMAQVAQQMGWANAVVANGAYGRLARHVAERLALPKPAEGFWGYVLMDWAEDEIDGKTAFVLRPEVVAVMTELGLL